jgi:hypothetical protein
LEDILLIEFLGSPGIREMILGTLMLHNDRLQNLGDCSKKRRTFEKPLLSTPLSLARASELSGGALYWSTRFWNYTSSETKSVNARVESLEEWFNVTGKKVLFRQNDVDSDDSECVEDVEFVDDMSECSEESVIDEDFKQDDDST